MKRLFFIITVILLAMGVTYSASNVEKRLSMGLDVMATGGAGVAGYHKFGLMYVNPASVAARDYGVGSILEIGANFNIDMLQILAIDFKDTNLIGNLDWASLLKLTPSLGITGPLRAGIYANGFTLMLYDDIGVSMALKQTALIPNVELSTLVDVGVLLGYAHDFYFPRGLLNLGIFNFDHLFVGGNLKLITRAKIDYPDTSFLDVLDYGMGISSGASAINLGIGVGLDLGAILKSDSLSFGVAIRDIYTPFTWQEILTTTGAKFDTTYFPASFDIGASYRIAEILNGFLLSDLMLYFDMVDIFNLCESYLLKFRLGAEITALKVLKLRVGLYKGYPTAGLGLDLPLLKLNTVYYTEELGSYPGSIPQQIFAFNIQFQL